MDTCQWNHAIVLVILLIIYAGDFVISFAPTIHCQVVSAIEETDPINRNLRPLFFKRNICKGGRFLNKGYQCQIKEKTNKEYKVLNVLLGKSQSITRQSATACVEVCVCGRHCKNPRPGNCGYGYSWDAKTCRCICNRVGTGGYQGNGPADSMPTRYFIIIIIASFTIFILLVIFMAVCCKDKVKRKFDKYRFLPRVEWNDKQEEKLKRHYNYDIVDAPERPGKKRNIFQRLLSTKSSKGQETTGGDGPGNRNNRLISNGNNGSTEQAKEDGIQTQAEKIDSRRCLDFSFVAFKDKNYREMLLWLEQAEKKERAKLQSKSKEKKAVQGFLTQLQIFKSFAYLVDGKIEDAKRSAERVSWQEGSEAEGANGRAPSQIREMTC